MFLMCKDNAEEYSIGGTFRYLPTRCLKGYGYNHHLFFQIMKPLTHCDGRYFEVQHLLET